jgi:hypothetical protein
VAAETGFLIDGTIYEVPALDSFTLDEEQVLYDWCQLVQEDFMSLEGETDEEYEERRAGLMRRPGFWAAWMQIAYQRANPKMKPEQVRQLIGTVNRQDALSTLGEPEEEESEVPLALTSEPNASSENGSLDNDNSTKPSPESSGTDATTDSDEADADPATTGRTRSDTSSTSPPLTSVA